MQYVKKDRKKCHCHADRSCTTIAYPELMEVLSGLYSSQLPGGFAKARDQTTSMRTSRSVTGTGGRRFIKLESQNIAKTQDT